MKSVIVVAADKANLEDVASQAASVGLTNVRTLPHLGMLAGQIPEERIDALKQLDSVKSVEREGSVNLPPPNSPIQ